MKNFKKLLTLLCLVTIVFTMLTGCDKKVEMVRISCSSFKIAFIILVSPKSNSIIG